MAEYIERKVAIQAASIWNGDESTEAWIQSALQKLPSADVRPVVRGHWIDGTCSNCGFFTDVVMSRFFSYCPNCGADMREKRY